MNLTEIRQEIDQVDEKLVQLLEKRMGLALSVAQFKKENHIPVLNQQREQEILQKVTDSLEEPLDRYGRIVFNTLFDVSRSYQNNYLTETSVLGETINKALEETPTLFPDKAVVACQGIEGAYSEAAAQKLFEFPSLMYFNSFEGVFNAVEKGLCKYGVLPIENSSYGSVGHVYDLMKNYKFSIVRSVKLRVSHKLLAKPGTRLADVKEIVSHEQAIGQCSAFIKGLDNVKVTVCENTALAAEHVAKSDRNDVAAISSSNCASLYGLEIIEENIQLSDNNYTRFICISKNMEIYGGANKISLMLSLPHRPMALYNMIAKFSALGINLTKLESRPIPGSDFEFMFYFDMEASLCREDVVKLLCELEQDPELFVFLGSYTEI